MTAPDVKSPDFESLSLASNAHRAHMQWLNFRAAKSGKPRPRTGGGPQRLEIKMRLACVAVSEEEEATGLGHWQGRMFRALHFILREKGAGALRHASSAFVNGFSSSSAPTNSQTQLRLAGKVAVITGGASGIGKATAAEFVRNGARVIIADVQDELGRAVAAELGGGTDCDVNNECPVRYTRCDVTDEAQVAAAVDLAVELHGGLDVMFNNAGIGGDMIPRPLGSLDMGDFDRVLAVNLRGVVAGVKHAARVMVPRRRGSIICTASTAALLGGIAPAQYCVSKSAVVGLVRAVAGELARSGVRVNAVSPHAIPTPLAMATVEAWFPGRSAEEHRRIVERDLNEMVGPVLEAEDIARAALYLASDEAKYVSGQNLAVDGGFAVTKTLNLPTA